jgi:hypothetical protein
MSGFLCDEDYDELLPAQHQAFRSPLPTRVVSREEFQARPQTERRRRLEARIKDLADRLAVRRGLSRRRFLAGGAGLAVSFVATNEVYGRFLEVAEAEAATAAPARPAGTAIRVTATGSRSSS